MMNTTRKTLTALLASAAVIAGAGGAAAKNIGRVSALNQDVEGTPPQADPRQLVIRDDVFANERIDSSPIGSGQFLFLDQTTLTIAKNSSIILDKYVYDPSTKVGEFAMSMSKGVLRFVGGRITKGTDAIVTTPTATIGIRGGMAIIIVDPDGTTRVMHIAGDYTRVTRNDGGGEIVISRSNGVVEVPFGGEPVYLGVADQQLIGETTEALTGRGEAGEKVDPQDPDVADSGVPDANSEAKGASSDDPISTRGESRRDESQEDEEDRRIAQFGEEITTPLATGILPNPGPGDRPTPRPDPGDKPTTPKPPEVAQPVLLPGVTGSASISGAGVAGLTSGGNGQTFVFTQIFEGSRIGVTANGDTFSIPVATGFFTFDASEGSSPNGGIAGSGFFDPDAEFTYTTFQTTTGDAGAFLAGAPSGALPNAAANQRSVRRYDLSDDLIAGAGPAFTGGLVDLSGAGQQRLTLLSNAGGAATGGDARAIATFFQISGTGTTQTSGLGVLTANVTAADSGSPSFSDFYDGVFRDSSGQTLRVENRVASVEDGQGGSAFGPEATYFALGNSDGVGGATDAGRLIDEAGTETLFGANHVASRARVQQLAAGAPTTASAPGGFAAISGFDLGSGDAYVGSSTRDSGVSLAVDSSTNDVTMNIRLDDFFIAFDGEGFSFPDIFDLRAGFGGGARGGAISNRQFAARQSTVDDDQSANFVDGLQTPGRQGGQNAFSGVMASAALVGDGGVFPAGVNTSPAFLSWGWWAGEFRFDPDEIGNPSNEGSELSTNQRFHLGAWVAGDVTANLPPSGIASYDGFAAISVVENGRAYVDGAGFGLDYDFGSNTGIVSLTDVVGANASIAVDDDVFGADYAGSAGITVKGQPGVIGVQGSFFNAGSTPAGATAGSLSFGTSNGAISGAGVFGGDRTSFSNVPINP